MSDIEQGSDAWRKARAGKITASKFADVIAKTKAGKASAARDRYLRELVFERMAGEPKHQVSSKSMSWGSEVESYAREAYELESGDIVSKADFVLHPKYDFIGCSPDGLIGADGGYESKCPHDEAVHIDTWLNGMPQDHMAQVQGCMLVTGRKYWIFVSYDPRQCEKLRLYHQLIERDDDYIAVLEKELLLFNEEVENMICELNKKVA